MTYAEEVERLRSQYGDLETIRKSLGHSRRQICEYLLVDPSAWTRWVREGQDLAPPHVYRTLSLLLDKLQDNPSNHGVKASQRLEETEASLVLTASRGRAMGAGAHVTGDQVHHDRALDQIQWNEKLADFSSGFRRELESDFRRELQSDVSTQFESLKKQVLQKEELSLGWKLLLLMNIGLVLYVLFR